jgi:hypothetical protein
MYTNPQGAIGVGFIVCIFAACWGWWFLFSRLVKAKKDKEKGNNTDLIFELQMAGLVCLFSHIPVILYGYTLLKIGRLAE